MGSIFSVLLLIFSISNGEETTLTAKDMPASHIQLMHKAHAPEFVAALSSNQEEIDEDGLTIVSDPRDVEVVVNKQRKLPDGYEPDDLVEADVPYLAPSGDPKRLLREEAAKALEELFAGAAADGLDLVAVSGYRSYERQQDVYEANVRKNGEEHANQFSAKPGTSEHQTGLAMDVASAAQVAVLEPSFIETEEGQWLDEHSHEYGFLIRYPEGKEDITGYSYEPWHLRYVGKETAADVHQAEETLEEYFGLIE
ncbi:M15 family metallopeptidase [Gracilibacillus alcaliphilus]|uniref:M15 family metallopeptidase n=1 Tax=Gracilibacillus alcaliphilus TaxID=1401441 RepID=UPI00195D2130|nr:M15 family metallopeptidase [Gracilibacillus alcaliphilus]MBM7675386.1 D-alanyl-D-alanine carboxypeptidase [Gracilibacillus alcaliphilus]